MSDNRTTKKSVAIKLLLFGLAVVIPAIDGVGEMLPYSQDLPQEVVELEEELHRALRHGDFDQIVELLPKAELLETHLLEIMREVLSIWPHWEMTSTGERALL